MNVYVLNWRDGTRTEVQGNSIDEAFDRYGLSNRHGVDYWERLREAGVQQWSVDWTKFGEVKEAVRTYDRTSIRQCE